MVFLVEDQQCVYADYKQNSEMFIPFRCPEQMCMTVNLSGSYSVVCAVLQLLLVRSHQVIILCVLELIRENINQVLLLCNKFEFM